jgi:hypothetical protein
MYNKRIGYGILVLALAMGLVLSFCITFCFAQDEHDESITITTYYPSPYGVYKQMRLYPTDDIDPTAACSNKGEMYYDDTGTPGNQLYVCDGSAWQGLEGYWAASPSDPNNIYNTNTGYVGIGTTNPQTTLDVAGATRLDGDILIVKNGVECSVYSDCDGDGKTYFSGDCDESCASCFVGSTAITNNPDGKDQNCNGIIDEFIGAEVSKTCNQPAEIAPGMGQSACASYCQSLGLPYSGYSAGSYNGCCNDEGTMSESLDFTTCTSKGPTAYGRFDEAPFTCECGGTYK